MSKQTLGELIAEALAGGEPRIDGDIAPTTPPMVRRDVSNDWDTVLRIFAEARENDPAKWGQLVSSWDAAQAIAEHYSLTFEEVRATMNTASQNLWHLLDTPQGWSVLGEQIALSIQGNPQKPALMPTVH